MIERPLKTVLKVAGTVVVLLTIPLWLPVCWLIYEVNWRGMWADLKRLHESLWS